MADPIAFLIERLKVEGEKTAGFFEGLAAESWQLPVYTEGETWTVRSVLAHFVSSERELLRLFATIRSGGLGAAADFDLDGFNAAQQDQAAEIPPAELLAQFRAARAAMIACVSGFDERDLERSGRHPALGMMTLGDMIKIVYRHNRLHERDLRQILPA